MAQNTLFRYTNDLSPFLSHLHSVYSISCPTFIVQQKRVSYFPFFHNNFLDINKVDKIILIFHYISFITRIVALYIIVFFGNEIFLYDFTCCVENIRNVFIIIQNKKYLIYFHLAYLSPIFPNKKRINDEARYCFLLFTIFLSTKQNVYPINCTLTIS